MPFGGRFEDYEQELVQARDSSLAKISQRAEQIGAQGIVGFRFDYEVLGQGNMLMVVATRTAVRFNEMQLGSHGAGFVLIRLT